MICNVSFLWIQIIIIILSFTVHHSLSDYNYRIIIIKLSLKDYCTYNHPSQEFLMLAHTPLFLPLLTHSTPFTSASIIHTIIPLNISPIPSKQLSLFPHSIISLSFIPLTLPHPPSLIPHLRPTFQSSVIWNFLSKMANYTAYLKAVAHTVNFRPVLFGVSVTHH